MVSILLSYCTISLSPNQVSRNGESGTNIWLSTCGRTWGLRGESLDWNLWEIERERERERKREAWQLTRTSQKPKLPWKQREHLTPIHVGINMSIHSLDFRALLPLMFFFLFFKYPFGHLYRHTIFELTICLNCYNWREGERERERERVFAFWREVSWFASFIPCY